MRLPFEVKSGIIASEFGVKSDVWEMTSGTLYLADNGGSTGVPDAQNNSAVFRMVSKKADFGDVSVSLKLMNQGLTAGNTKTPAVDWDGVHVFLRYLSPYNLYYASVNRRDGKIIFKKKIPGGPSNQGTYYEIGKLGTYQWQPNVWQDLRAEIKTLEAGKVLLCMCANGKVILSAVDDGSVGGPAIVQPGRVGLRIDNCKAQFRDFEA